MPKQAKTAAQFLAELEADPNWRAERDQREREQARRAAVLAEDERELVAEIRAAGYDVDSVYDLVNYSDPSGLSTCFTYLQRVGDLYENGVHVVTDVIQVTVCVGDGGGTGSPLGGWDPHGGGASIGPSGPSIGRATTVGMPQSTSDPTPKWKTLSCWAAGANAVAQAGLDYAGITALKTASRVFLEGAAQLGSHEVLRGLAGRYLATGTGTLKLLYNPGGVRRWGMYQAAGTMAGAFGNFTASALNTGKFDVTGLVVGFFPGANAGYAAYQAYKACF